MTNVKYNGDIRLTKELNDAELRASLMGGWDENLPAIKDERGEVLVGNRRMVIAKEEGIKPVIKVVTFGDGPEAEAARIRLANVSNIGAAALTPQDRKRQSIRLYEGGLTQAAIAHTLGVSQRTISEDLRGLEVTSKPSRPKGGRPKGSKSAAPKEEKKRSTPVLDRAQARKEVLETELPTIDPATLSMTAQEKLSVAIRQEKARLAESFNAAVAKKVRQTLDEIVLPEQRTLINEAKHLYDKRYGLMDKGTFNTIRRGLHPDSRKSISDQKLGEAFDKFMSLEKYLLSEQDSPTDLGNLPNSMAEWDAMKRSATAERKAGRNAVRPRAT